MSKKSKSKILKGDEKAKIKCQWFLKCTNNATTTMQHPILGKVPICKQCKEKMEKIALKTKNA